MIERIERVENEKITIKFANPVLVSFLCFFQLLISRNRTNHSTFLVAIVGRRLQDRRSPREMGD